MKAKPGDGAKQTMADEEKLGARRVKFPSTPILGLLFIREWGMPGYGGWQQHAEARGEIDVPPGKELMLQLNWRASTDLAPLARLRPNDLQWLDCRDSQINDAQMAHLKGLTQLHDLGLGHTAIGDVGMRTVGELAGLKELFLAGTRISDAGSIYLARLKNLEALALNDTALGDAALENIQGLASLQRLWLKNTRVSDAGLPWLKGMKSLRRLDVRGTAATPEGIGALKRALPRCYLAR